MEPGRLRTGWTFLRAQLNLAIEEEVLDKNRRSKDANVPEGDTRDRVFTNAELIALFTHSKPREQRAWAFLLSTGFRPGKILELTSEHITIAPMHGLNMPPSRTK